jgi:RNA polymerase sigma factor (sigma-70 family)
MREQTPGHDWIEEFKEGKERAFKKVYEEFFYPLSYFATQLIHSQPEAEEIAADSLYKLMQGYQKFDTYQHIRSFLYRVTRNHCYDVLRSRHRAPRQDTSLEDDSIIDHDDLVINLIIKSEIMEAIYQEIEHLPRLRRDVFTLFYLDGLKMGEIAHRLGIKVDVVRSTKSKAAAQLRDILGQRKFLLPFTLLFLHTTDH